MKNEIQGWSLVAGGGGIRRGRPDISMARGLLGWEPKTTLSNGLRDTPAAHLSVIG